MTDLPEGALTQSAYHSRIRGSADDLLALIRNAPLDAGVPACPGWTVHDLISHLGQVHQFSASNITDPDSAPHHRPTPLADGEDLAEWYDRSVTRLLDALDDAGPEAHCWTLLHGHKGVPTFWARRQSHELAMHRVDLEQALGCPDVGAGYDPELAADGIAEVLDVMIHVRSIWGDPPLGMTAPVLLECTDRPERWLLTPRADGPAYDAEGPTLSDHHAASAGATVRGTANELLLVLWRRTGLDTIEVSGHADVVRRMLEARLTP